jgi:phage-related protein
MKSTFFSVAAMVASAFAAPLQLGGKDVVSGVLHEVDSVTKVADVASANGLVGGVTQVLPVKRELLKAGGKAGNKIVDSAGLVTILTTSVSSVTAETKIIDELTAKVKSGDITVEEAEKESLVHLTKVKVVLTDIVDNLTGTIHIKVLSGDVDTILSLVIELVTVLFTSVNALVTVLGLTPLLNALLQTVFSLLATVLTLVTGLVSTLVPAVLAALAPILSTVTGILGPVLTPILGFVTASVPAALGLNLPL